MLFKSALISSLVALSSAASVSGRAARSLELEARQGACGECPEGTHCQPYGGLLKCMPPAKRDLELEARQGACGECPEGTSCHPYGGLLKCQPDGAEKRAMCRPGGEDCPAGQSCVQYGEMGGIYRCQ